VSTWLDVQRQFRATVTGQEDVLAPLVRALRGPVGRRIAVYRNTVQQSLVDILAVAFPSIQRIVGAEFFHALARSYVTTHPPSVPQLSLYGAEFAAFIATHPRTTELPYLADVAHLEWARSESYFAADAPYLDPARLSEVPHDRLGDLCFKLHPATRMIMSPFPVHRIWAVNQPDVEDVPVIDMTVAESAMATRQGHHVHVRLLATGDAAFVASAQAGESLGVAVVKALEADAMFDLQVALQAHLIGGTFTTIALA
jgi:hypothetical protein